MKETLSNVAKIIGYKTARDFCKAINKPYRTVLHQYQNNKSLFEADKKRATEKLEEFYK